LPGCGCKRQDNPSVVQLVLGAIYLPQEVVAFDKAVGHLVGKDGVGSPAFVVVVGSIGFDFVSVGRVGRSIGLDFVAVGRVGLDIDFVVASLIFAFVGSFVRKSSCGYDQRNLKMQIAKRIVQAGPGVLLPRRILPEN